jgi:hypothetical protein
MDLAQRSWTSLSGTDIEAAHIPKLVANKVAATANKLILRI